MQVDHLTPSLSTGLRPKHALWAIALWTIGLVLDVALVDGLLDVTHGLEDPL